MKQILFIIRKRVIPKYTSHVARACLASPKDMNTSEASKRSWKLSEISGQDEVSVLNLLRCSGVINSVSAEADFVIERR